MAASPRSTGTDLDLEQKAVELRLGQRIGVRFDGVLRGEHHEGLWQRERLPFECHLVFLHRFEQRLRLGRRAVDLVGQQHVREDRAAHDPQLTARLIEHRVAGDIRRHHVGGELDAGM
jgi:hypothetical protein